MVSRLIAFPRQMDDSSTRKSDHMVKLLDLEPYPQSRIILSLLTTLDVHTRKSLGEPKLNISRQWLMRSKTATEAEN